MSSRVAARLLALAALPLTLAACGATVASLEPNPQEVRITSADQSPTIQVTPKDEKGDPINPPPTYTWASSDEAVATVDASGTITAKATGDAQVTVAEPGGKTATLKVMVTFPERLVIVSGAEPQLKVGETRKLAAEVKDALDRTVDGHGVEWTSADAALASVAGGTLTGVAPGKVRVEARSGSLTTGFDLEVLPAEPVATAR